MVDTAEAARLLGVSDTTLNVWVAAGKLPRFREGGVYRFRVADLDAFSKERTKVKNERRKQGKEETTVEP
jgi:excisionase family DNA binding protein